MQKRKIKTITRRKTLKMGAFAAGWLGSPWLYTQCRKSGAVREPAVKQKSKVAAICGENLQEMTRNALEELGGIQAIIDKDDKVFIKPNFVSIPWARTNNCFRLGECTKPEIIIAVTQECLKAGAAEVIIGEGSHLPSFDWRYAVTFDGSTNLVREANRLTALYPGTVTLACLETDSPEWVEVPSQTSLKKIAVSGLAAGADKVISIPVAKTHSWAQLTLAAKNFLGITPLSRYAQLIDNTWWNRGTFDHRSPRAIAQVYLDIVKSIKPDLSIVDFSIGIEGDGPTTSWGGKPRNMKDHIGTWAIIASTDIMAADATAARIMDQKTQNVTQLVMGHKMGLGEIRKEAIDVSGADLADLRSSWKPARLRRG